jgi:hypothetical protein
MQSIRTAVKSVRRGRKLQRGIAFLRRITRVEDWRARLRYDDISGGAETPTELPLSVPLHSGLCRQSDFLRDGYRYWISAIKEQPRFHRKQWEFYYIIQALFERGLLEPGRRLIGFGVGLEPLPALFASRGALVLASDQRVEQAQQGGWAQTDQHASGLSPLNDRGICEDDVFRRNVTFREIDMNHIPPDLAGLFDACWSACSLEHLGSLEHGIDFVLAALDTLRPGGVAIHTTEFNLSSNDDTIESQHLSLFRRRDIEDMIEKAQAMGHKVEPVEWTTGSGFVDGYVDLPPYRTEPHLKLSLHGYTYTSIGMIITKSPG